VTSHDATTKNLVSTKAVGLWQVLEKAEAQVELSADF
jgi:hypothetical protein